MNGFDLVSHFFGTLPIYMAYTTNQIHLLIFTLITVITSFIYHLDENKVSLHFDEFASSALIVVTFMTYINGMYKSTYLALALLLGVVITDYYLDFDLVTIFVGLVVFTSILVFIHEKRTLKVQPQRLNVTDIYFLSFVSTQVIAIAFFLWDKDPYAHSLWHLFAFTSLGSAIAHVHENDMDLKRKVFYWLGSIPSRLFISAILIHWDTVQYPHNLPIAAFALLGIGTRKRLQGGLYIAMGILVLVEFKHNMAVAGGVLILSTILSARSWLQTNKPKPQVQTYKKIQLENLRF